MTLGEREPENETDKFGRSSLEGVAANWMMKCDGRWEVNHKCIHNVYILCSISSWSLSAVYLFVVVVGRLAL